jgi:hypothetical protein
MDVQSPVETKQIRIDKQLERQDGGTEITSSIVVISAK